MNWKAIGITLLGTFMLTACQNNDGTETGQGLDNGIQQTRTNNTGDYPLGNRNNQGQNNIGNMNNQGNNQGNNNAATRNNTNEKYENNEELGRKISAEVESIDRAYVFTTGDNAYVAAELNRGTKDNNQNNTGNNNNGTNNGATGNDGNAANMGMAAGNNGTGGNGNNNGNNNGNEVSDKVREEVTKVIKSQDNNIKNVYVSTNPDFVNLTNNYANDVQNGEPVEGFFNEFGEMVQRIFPQGS